MKTLMQAPKGVTSATIEGQEYDIPKDGVIEVRNAGHIPTLKRHGFTDFVEEVDEADLSDMSKQELIEFCEERGGDTDGLKKSELLKLARELQEA